MKVETLTNNSFETTIAHEGYIQTGPFAEIRSTEIAPPANVNGWSMIVRCNLGKYFNIGLYSYIADAEVGRYCTFGSRCSIGAFSHPTDWLSVHEFQYRDTSTIWGETINDNGINLFRTQEPQTFIGNDVWIGDNSVIMRGVTIGDGAIIGASSVVTKDVPPYTIAVGNPARPVRLRFSEEIVARLRELKWWEFDMSELRGVSFGEIEKAIEQISALKKETP